MEEKLYNKKFYDNQQQGSRKSAQVVVPIIINMIQPKTVVDVGCGVGTWLSVFDDCGVQEYLGIDGEYVDEKLLMIPKEKYKAFDLKNPINLNREFDLVVSLEAAEHLPAENAEEFIKSLTSLGPVVMFSAAIPFQGGIGHINEQWPEYWQEYFKKYGYVGFDIIRSKIWNDTAVKPWYSQNILLYIRENYIDRYPQVKREVEGKNLSPIALVHPKLYVNSLNLLERAIKQKHQNPLNVLGLTEEYEKRRGKAAEEQLRKLRKQIAEFWIVTADEQLESVYLSDIGKAHQILIDSSIKDEAIREIEEDLVNEVTAQLSKGLGEAKVIPYILVGMLYCPADQLLLPCELNKIPDWLLNDYIQYIIKSPSLFKKKGEVDKYYNHMQRWVNYIHSNVVSSQNLKIWQHVALSFTQNANFIPLYFTDKNLREIYTKRADIMELTLKQLGHQIDYDFPERTADRKKIRLGVLGVKFASGTQIFATVPAFEYLDRNKFEIILYALQLDDNAVEQYCLERADRLVELPNDLLSQVQAIRADDLDMLLLGTNVTAVTYQITLLALHRLAPVQLSMIRSPVTTGMRTVDYYISGKLSEPATDAQQQYREQLVTIEGCGICFNYKIQASPPTLQPDRDSLGITEQAVVFMSGANFYKIIPELRESWAKIITEVANSVLVLYPFSQSWSSSYPEKLFLNCMRKIFAEHGIEENRLILLETIPSRSDVKEYLKLGDVYLDSYPHSGSHTVVDPLEVGLPPVVRDGNSVRSKHGAAILREIEMPELIAADEEDYIRLAIALGNDPELRKEKSDQIQERMRGNPRFLDSRDYSSQMGALFQELFKKYQTDTLNKKFRLRDINLIIFPDWNQSEESLYQDLASAIMGVATHPDKNQITLLINTTDISEEDADAAISSVVMSLLMSEDLDVDDGPEITLIGQLSEMQWELLLPRIHSRIGLENENQEAIARVKATNLPCCELDNLPNISFLAS